MGHCSHMRQSPLCLQTVILLVKGKEQVESPDRKVIYVNLCPLLAKGVLVPLGVTPRAPWLLGNGLVAPGAVSHCPSAVLEAALGGPLVLMTTVKLTLTSHSAPWLATTTSKTWFASNTSGRTTHTSTTTAKSTSST